MTKLRELTRLIRSKNAGPFELTFDVMFTDPDVYKFVKDAGVINQALFARLYSVREDLVRVYAYDPAFSYKITVPRSPTSGSLGDNDVYGCQQFAPLVDLDIPIDIPN